MKIKIQGITEVTVYTEIEINNDKIISKYKEDYGDATDEEILNDIDFLKEVFTEEAEKNISTLSPYCGNGGVDKLIGVDGDDNYVEASECIEWQSIEVIED